jgi:hypothetical protein
MRKILAVALLVVCSFTFQKSNYDYTLTIKVEGKSLEESMRIKDELIKYCEKNKLAIEQYAKKEFEMLQYEKSIKKLK